MRRNSKWLSVKARGATSTKKRSSPGEQAQSSSINELRAGDSQLELWWRGKRDKRKPNLILKPISKELHHLTIHQLVNLTPMILTRVVNPKGTMEKGFVPRWVNK